MRLPSRSSRRIGALFATLGLATTGTLLAVQVTVASAARAGASTMGSTTAEEAVGLGTGSTALSTTGSGDAAAPSAATVSSASGATTAATPIALAVPMGGMTAASAAVLPDTGGSGTVLVMAGVLLLLCAAAALALVHARGREQHLP